MANGRVRIHLVIETDKIDIQMGQLVDLLASEGFYVAGYSKPHLPSKAMTAAVDELLTQQTLGYIRGDA